MSRWGRSNDRRWVYFARKRDDKTRIKIGFSENVPMRMSSLGCVPLLTVSMAFHQAPKVERRLHEEFADLRVTGEWFKADDPLLKFIAVVRSTKVWPWQHGKVDLA